MADSTPATAIDVAGHPRYARRWLDFSSFDDVIADARQLEQGYVRTKKWTLGECCDHLGRFMQMSLEGFPGIRLPAPLAYIVRSVALNRSLRTRRLPGGVPAPGYLRPAASGTSAEALVPASEQDCRAVEAMVALVRRVEAHEGGFARSPLFGTLSPEVWREVHLIHCAHHLGHLVPVQHAAHA